MKSDVIRKHSQHDVHRGSSGSAGHGSGHSSETPSASLGASCCPSLPRDADGGVSPTLVFDSNLSAFDDIDVDSASIHNGLVNSRCMGFGYVPPTQSDLVGALGGSNTYSYPGLNLLDFHVGGREQYRDACGPVVKCRRMSDDSITKLRSSAALFSSFGDSGFSTSSATSASGSARHSWN